MVSSMEISGILGKYQCFFAWTGVISLSYIALKLSLAVIRGVKTFFLARALGLSADLKKFGQWAVVTGATDGIGKAYAEQIAKQGLNIVLVSRTKAKLDAVSKEIENKYKVKTLVITADFSAGSEIYAPMAEKLKELDIGILVNNVGLSYNYPEFFAEIPDRDKLLMDLINLNITSMTMMTSIVLPAMANRKRGLIINLSSASGQSPMPLLSVYSACKAYVDFLSRTLHTEYQSRGIIVQCVAPFFVATKMSKRKRASWDAPFPDAYVRSALSTVGVQSRTNGYWSHALMGWVGSSLPEWVLNKHYMSVMLGLRKRAKKYLTSTKSD